MNNDPCVNCGITESNGQWWNLHNYFKLSGRFCPECYDLVAHDSNDNPNNPGAYILVLLKQQAGH